MERILFIEFLLCSASDHFCGRNDHRLRAAGCTAGGRRFYKARRENNQPPSLWMAFGDGCKVWNIPSHPVNIPLNRRRGKSIKCCERRTDLRSDHVEMFPTPTLGPQRNPTPKTCLGLGKIHSPQSQSIDRCIDNNASDLTASAATSPLSL